jgi:hypothetical protein
MAMATSSTSMSAPVSQQEVAKAQAYLNKMRRSLAAWLKYRRMSDEVAAGARQTKKPLAVARQIVSQRDWNTEQKLADQLHVLLSEVMPDAALPDPSVKANPNAAVQLAQIAIGGTSAASSPTATGSTPPWLWPVVIVGALLLAVTTAISSYADVAKSHEQYACIQAGACTDYGFWLKAGGIAMLGWFLWTQTSLPETVRAFGKRGGR